MSENSRDEQADKDPLTLSKGVTSKGGLTGISIDWITYTVPFMEIDGCVPQHKAFVGIGTEETRPVPPYVRAEKRGCASVFWHPRNPRLKRMVRITGEGMREMREAGMSDEAITRWLNCPARKVTRIDVAIDRIGDERTDVYQIWQSKLFGVLRTTAQKVSHILEEDIHGRRFGCTIYIGSRDSNWYIRAYDKGAQMNANYPWVRVEIEAKDIAARELVAAMARDGLQAVVGPLEARMDPSLDWWDDMLEQYDGTKITIPRKKTDADEWLYKTALPAVLKAIWANDPYVKSRIEAALYSPPKFAAIDDNQET